MNGLDLNKVNQSVLSAIKNVLKDDFIALISSGSSLNNFIPGWSDVDYLIVIKEMDCKSDGKISDIFAELSKTFNIKFGLNLITEDELFNPLLPELSQEGKTLQALLELRSNPGRLIYLNPKFKDSKLFYVPNLEEIKKYSLLNIGRLKQLNRRNLLVCKQDGKKMYKEVVSKSIHWTFIIVKLSIQHFTLVVPVDKKQMIDIVEKIFPGFNFNILRQDLKLIKNWGEIDKTSLNLEDILRDNNVFIEEFSNLVFRKAMSMQKKEVLTAF